MTCPNRRGVVFRAMRKCVSVGMLAVLTLVVSACGKRDDGAAAKSLAATTPSQESDLPVMYAAPTFQLTDQNGNAFSSGKLAGHVWVADFIFTRCPGPCPIMTQNMKKLQDEFSDAKGLRFVSISVDPDYDKPEVLRKYARRFGADTAHWSFLTGDRSTIMELSVKGFKLAAAPAEDAGDASHPIVHSQRYALVDRAGNIRGYYNGLDTEDLSRLHRDLRQLLGSQGNRE